MEIMNQLVYFKYVNNLKNNIITFNHNILIIDLNKFINYNQFNLKIK